jgi:hypothetical protein
MKFMTVGLLAMVGLSACGVGVEDPEGQQAVGVARQAVQTVYVTPDGKVIGSAGQTTADTTAPTGPGNGGQNELPQDPVPEHHPNVIVVMPAAQSAR